MRAVVWVLAWGKRESCMWNNLEGMRAWFVPLEPLSELRLQLWIFRALFSFILSFKWACLSPFYLNKHPDSFRKEALTMAICCWQSPWVAHGKVYFWSGCLAPMILTFMLWAVKGMEVLSCPVAQGLDLTNCLSCYTCVGLYVGETNTWQKAPHGRGCFGSVVHLEAECAVGGSYLIWEVQSQLSLSILYAILF